MATARRASGKPIVRSGGAKPSPPEPVPVGPLGFPTPLAATRFCTVHANSAQNALGRLEDLCAEVCPQPPCRSIATAIGCIVFVQRTTSGREIREVVFVDGWKSGEYVTTAKCE